jgi:transposase
MDRRYGWGDSSSRVIGQVPFGHWRTTTFVAGLRSTGLIAPLVLDGPMSSESFLAYVKQFLIPTLKRGDLVVLDNLSSHKQAEIQETILSVGADLVYLPPYSPDLNPIEKLFAKFKALLRTHAERTVEALWKRVGQVLDEFTPQECLNYIKSSGYTADQK